MPLFKECPSSLNALLQRMLIFIVSRCNMHRDSRHSIVLFLFLLRK